MKKQKKVLLAIIPIFVAILVALIVVPTALSRKKVENNIPDSLLASKSVVVSAEDTGAATAETRHRGGGLYLKPGSKYTMKQGQITGKASMYGGAVYVSENATFTMTGGSISDNWAKYGGAIYVASGGTCVIKGGTISGNFAENAPAIYMEEGAIVDVEDDSLVSNNTQKEYNIKLTIFVDGAENKTVNVLPNDNLSHIALPLTDEQCCGYFLDEKLTSDSYKYPTFNAMYRKTGISSLYTMTATIDKFDSAQLANGIVLASNADKSSSGNVVAPRKYNGKLVNQLVETNNVESGSFYRLRYGKIYIPSSITEIKPYSFYSTVVCEVNIHDCVTNIREYGFASANTLKGVTIPKNMSVIRQGTFQGASVSGLVIPGNIKTIETSAFYNYNAQLTFEEGLERIEDGVFQGSTITSFVFPDSLKYVGDNNFCDSFYSYDVDISFGSGLEHLGVQKSSSWHQRIKSIRISEDNPYFTSRDLSGTEVNAVIDINSKQLKFGCKNTVIPADESVETIAECAFYKTEALASITIPSNIKTIMSSAFSMNEKLTSVQLSEGLQQISDMAFSGCRQLAEIAIPTTVKEIGYASFSGCSSITEIVIPANLNVINDLTFNGCTSLTEIAIPNNVTAIGNKAFYGCSSLSSVVLSEQLLELGEEAFRSCVVLSTITIPGSLKTISKRCFASSGLSTITISNGVETIDYEAFTKSQLINVKIPDSVTLVGEQAFIDCEALQSVEIGDGDTNIGRFAFGDCTALTTVSIGNGHLSIGVSAFNRDTSLKNVTMGPNVYSIGGSAFSQSIIENIDLPDNLLDFDTAFSMCAELKEITIPNRVKTIAGLAFGGCEKLTKVYNLDHVTSIGAMAFGNTGLVNIILPDSVENIGQAIFYQCSKLETVIFGSGLKTCEGYIVAGCSNLKSIYIPENTSMLSSEFAAQAPATAKIYLQAKADSLLWASNWNSATETEKLVCIYDTDRITYCQLEHNATVITMGEATCTEPGIGSADCPVCGDVVGITPPLGHISDNWIIDSESTCQTHGSRHGVCSRCGLEVVEELPLSGHNYVDGVCSVCGKTLVVHVYDMNEADEKEDMTTWTDLGIDILKDYHSENHDDGSISAFIVMTDEECTISFEYRLSADNSDIFIIYLVSESGEPIDSRQVNGENAEFATYSCTLKPGQMIQFGYVKDDATSGGDDCVYIKNFTVH